MARPRKVQPTAELETAPVPEVQPTAERHTLASLGYQPGDSVSLEHINLLANQ